ncbi:lipopolysaccharide biosynthesis protein [Pseudonocardia nematodicida]|uniref:Lipopolysaccharide biosynthesis protein n=1 Tax=Pseudonocardia nematodicida TaxID=1206997 RepID=A0ABV1KDD7_9PSEU
MAGRLRSARREMNNPLYRNAYALMLNTVVNSGFGLLYWIFAARTYSPEDVGRGSALVNLMMLISVLTSLNFGQALIRFLPTAGNDSSRLVNRAYVVSAGLGTLAAAGVMTYLNLTNSPGDPLWVSPLFGFWFVVSTAAWSIFNLQDQVFTGLRSAVWVALKNGVYGVVKLMLLVAVSFTSVSDGVFTSWSAPVLALLVPFSLLITRRVLPRHVTSSAAEPGAGAPDGGTLRRYMAGDYMGQVFNQATSSFLPVLIIALLGAQQSAYLLPAQTMFIALNLLSVAIMSSLVVEGSRDPSRSHLLARAILRRIMIVVVPAALAVGLAAPWLLLLYGGDYADNATLLLQLLMASIMPRVVVTLWMTRSRLASRTFPLAAQQLFHAVVVIGGTTLLAPVMGLEAVGWSWLAAEFALAAFLLPIVVRWLRGTSPLPARDVDLDTETTRRIDPVDPVAETTEIPRARD